RRIPELNDDPAWRAFNRFRSLVRAPGGEHMLEVQTRMITELERIRAAHPHGIVAVISHGDALRAAILHYLGMPLDFIHRIEISPASVTAVDVSDGAPRLRCLNWRAPDDGGKFCL
ncbi:MAG: histidine phosphatase family protein, partial [Acidobacteria bacterium]|nr:histidine phosphatase family protein [Acidobacteriota bacterium]